jgi:hypothetical protein
MIELLSGMAIVNLIKFIFGSPEFRAKQKAIRAEILQKHRAGISLAIHGTVDYMQSRVLLTEVKNQAEKFDRKLFVDIKQSLEDVTSLMQYEQFLSSTDLSREERERYSMEIAHIKSRLLTKLRNLG